MPAKTVVCDICKQEVSKRSTLSIGDGKRACRHHEHTQQVSEEIALQEKQKKEGERRKIEEKRQRHKFEKEAWQDIKKPRCLICLQEGIRQKEYYLTLLKEMQKFKLVRGKEPNLFDEMDVRKITQVFDGKPCLYFVSWEGENANVKIPYDAWQIASIIGSFFCCGKCLREKGLKSYSDQQTESFFEKHGVEAGFEKMTKLSIILEPVFENAARREITENS